MRPNTTFVQKSARVFHGNALHEKLWVVVNGERIGAGDSCRGRLPGTRPNLSPDELKLTVATARRPTSPWPLTSTVEGMRGLLWPARIRPLISHRTVFEAGHDASVTIVSSSDPGTFPHGDNAVQCGGTLVPGLRRLRRRLLNRIEVTPQPDQQ